MKSWTRTLNIDDTHTLLAHTIVGLSDKAWTSACHGALPKLSVERRRELIRILRSDFLTWTDDKRVANGLFLRLYQSAPARDQIDLVNHIWAASHPLSLATTDTFIRPILRQSSAANPIVTLPELDAFVGRTLTSKSRESLRKSRTVLINALEGIGVLIITGTGKGRVIRAAHGAPSSLSFAYLLMIWIQSRGDDGVMTMEATESSLPVQLTGCTTNHAENALRWAVQTELITNDADEVSLS